MGTSVTIESMTKLTQEHSNMYNSFKLLYKNY